MLRSQQVLFDALHSKRSGHMHATARVLKGYRTVLGASENKKRVSDRMCVSVFHALVALFSQLFLFVGQIARESLALMVGFVLILIDWPLS